MSQVITRSASVRMRRGAIGSCMLVVLLFGVQPARAADAADDNPVLEEVVVTAQKREESINKVPVSVSVLGRDEMQQRGIENIADVAAVSPGVDFQNTGTTTAIALRGISSGIVGYSTTGIYIDDVPVQIRLDGGIVPGTNTTPLVFDLDRVEVLRGPQGTLFGAGAEGGTIRFIQPQPSLTQFSGYARAGLATTDGGGPGYEMGAAFGGPIVADELGFRVSAWHRRDGGYIDHESAIAGGTRYSNSGWRDSDVLRAAFAFAPMDSVKITPSMFYQHIHWNDVPTFDPAGSPNPGDTMTANWASLGPQYSNVDSGHRVFQGLLVQPSSDQLFIPSVKIEGQLPQVTLTSTTSFMNRRYSAQQDFSTVNPVIIGLPWPTTANAASISYTPSNQNVFTQELRAQSANPQQRLQWTFGLFFSDSRQMGYQSVWSPYWPTQIQQAFGQSIQQQFGQALLPGDLSIYEREPITDKQLAAYGQLSYQLINHVSLVAGARVARETDRYSIYINGPLNGPTATSFSGTENETVVDPRYGVNVQLDDNNLVYFSAAKGDRIGGVNSPFYNFEACNQALAALGFPNGAPKTYQGDSLWSYEIGSKNRLFNGRFQIQVSAFHIQWNNIQQIVQVPACTEGFTSNLGKATSNGFDLQADLLVTDALKLGLNMGYTNARNATTIVSGGNDVVADGQQVNPYSSPWIVSPTAEYTFAIAAGHKGYIRIEDTFHSRNPGPYNPTADTTSPTYNAFFIPNAAYNQLDLHVGTTWSGWDLAVYATNALNSHPLLYNNAIQPFTFYGTTFTLQPRTIGVTAMYHW
jgi:outer membrane receptor protein involved in Fe transport